MRLFLVTSTPKEYARWLDGFSEGDTTVFVGDMIYYLKEDDKTLASDADCKARDIVPKNGISDIELIDLVLKADTTIVI